MRGRLATYLTLALFSDFTSSHYALTILPLTTITIRDDRGCSVELWRQRAGSLAEDSIPADLQLRIAAVVADRHKGILREPLTAAHLPIVVAVLAIACTPVLFGVLGITPPAYLFPAAIGLVFPLFFLLRTRAIRRGMADALRATLLAEGYCASCGYSMHGLAPEPDGCTTCPECSAAWRLSDTAARPSPDNQPKEDPREIEQDRADRRHVQNTLRSFGLRRRFAAVDASGQIVGLVSPDPFAKRPTAWRHLDPPRQRRLRRRFLRLGLGLRILFAVITVPGAVMMAWSWTRMGTSSPLTNPLMFIGRIFGTFIWPVMIALFVFRPHVRRAEVLVGLMLEEGCCPSCAEPLAGQPLDAHDVIICRACGASWNAHKAAQTNTMRPGRRG